MNPVEIYIECEVLQVRLRLAPATDASRLETLVLRAIEPELGAGDGPANRGVDTHLELARLFGLTPRMMIDLLGDLWRAQRVSIDFGAQPERIRLTDKARTELQKLADEQALQSSIRAADTQEVLLESLTGAVLPIGTARWRPRHAGLKLPRTSSDKRPADIERHELITAVERALRRHDDRPPFRVVDAHLVPNAKGSGNPIQYFPLTVKAGVDNHDRLVVQVDDRALSRTAQRVATQKLQKFIEDEPNHNFVKTLRGQATPIREPLERIDRQLAALQRSIGGLSATDQPYRQSEHDRLAAAAALLGNQIQDMAARQMRITTLRTTDEHRAEIRAMLESACHQVIFAVPWIRYNGLYPYLDAIAAAVDRGVHITILWGIDRQRGALDNPVLNALDGIQRAAQAAGARGALHYDRSVPSHIHAKLVIADDRRILVTSKNFFTDTNHAEFGASAAALDDIGCPVIEEAVKWARDTTPSARIAEAIVTDRRVFGERGAQRAITHPVPRLNSTIISSPTESAPVRIWARAWQATGTNLSRVLAELLPAASLITDGLHRSLMWEALRGASSRVVICSDRLSPDIVTDDFIKEVDSCLARGTDVTIVYSRFPEGEQERGERQVAALAALSEARENVRGRLVLRNQEATHAKVLVDDDSVVIGSYNYLSFEATYRSGRRRQRSEVSLQLHSPTLASTVATLLGGFADRARVTDGNELAGGVDDVRANEILAELDAPATPQSAYTISALCRSGTTDLAVAQALVSADADPDLLERAYAATVANITPDDTAYADWHQLLLQLLWRRGKWSAAQVIRAAIDSDTVRPRRILTAVAAVNRSPIEATAVLEEAALADTLTVSEASAVAVSAALGYLDTGEPSLRQVTDVIIGTVAPTVRRFTEIALDQVSAFGLLPRQALAERSSVQTRDAESEDAWRVLDGAIAALRKARPSCIQEKLTKSHLLEPTGSIGTLEAIAEVRDTTQVGNWLEHNDDDLGQWLDKATRASGSHHLINGRSRRVMMSKAGDIFRAARALAAAESSPAHTAVITPEWEAHLQLLADAAREARQDLPADIESHLTAHLLDDLIDTLTSQQSQRDADRRDTWSQAWRNPRLLVADLFESPGPQQRAQLVALDLYRAWSPDAAVDWLIDNGEFLAAADLVDQLEGIDTTALSERIDSVHMNAVERATARCRELLARFDRAGLPEPALPDPEESLELRSAATMAELDEIAGQLQKAEQEAGQQLENELGVRGDTISADLARHVRELIRLGEFSIARQALDSNDNRPLVPLHTTEHAWRWPHTPLEQITRSLTNSLARKPGMEIFAPSEDDTAGRCLVEALARIAAGAPGAVGDYVGAIQNLIAQIDVSPVLTEDADTIYSRLVLPDTTRLPRLSFVGRDGVRVAVGPRSGDAQIRLSLQVTETAQRGARVVLDIASILSLLAKDDDGKPRDRSDRYVALLRMICTQLEFEDVIEPNALAYASVYELRPRLWWLLYLLSVGNAAALVDGLLEISGSHPRPLWEILRQEVNRVRNRGGLFSLERIRTHFDSIAVEAVITDIDDDPAAATLLVMIGYNVFDEQGIRDGVVDILRQLRSPVSVDGIIDIDNALSRLRGKHYVPPQLSSDNELQLCGCGAIRAIARANPLDEAECIIARLVTAHENDRRRSARDAMRRRAAIGYLHELGRPATGIDSDPRADVEVNRKTSELENEWLQPRVVDVYAETAKVCARLRLSAGSVDILLSPEHNPGAMVLLPPLALVLLVENLVKNAVEAAADTDSAGTDSGTVSVKISIDEPACSAVIDVGDSGRGVTDLVRESLERREAPLSTKHDGHGVGLHEALVTVADCDGTLTLLPDRSRWGGACFRATLPLHLPRSG